MENDQGSEGESWDVGDRLRPGIVDPIWHINIRESMHVVIPVIIAACLTAYGVYPPYYNGEIHELECRHDITADNPHAQQCYHHCSNGTFTLHNLEGCVDYLQCEDVQKIELGELIGEGLVKKVYLGEWKGHKVAVNTLNQDLYRPDFQHGLAMLKGLQRHPRVIQLLGWCGDTYITEYHRHGSLLNFDFILGQRYSRSYNNLTTRFMMCLHYAQSLKYLHESPLGVRVMCDSNDLQKTLSQYLLTFDLQLILNDVDALPEVVHGHGIKCGPRQLFGDFVAPEQLWPYSGKKFNDVKMPHYTEKIDVWKIPDVCLHFLGDNRGSDVLKYHLHKIHQKCKEKDPRNRPTADAIVREYERVKKYISLHSYKET